MNGMPSILSQIIMTSLRPKESPPYETLKQSAEAYLQHRQHMPYLGVIRKEMVWFNF